MINYDHEKCIEDSKQLLKQSNCYEVILSTKDRLKCDADELWRVLEAIKTGSPAMLRQGLFNPSYYVAIVEDEYRYRDFKESVYMTLKSNKQAFDYNDLVGIKELPKLTLLKDIFAGTNLKALSTNGQKMLKDNA